MDTPEVQPCNDGSMPTPLNVRVKKLSLPTQSKVKLAAAQRTSYIEKCIQQVPEAHHWRLTQQNQSCVLSTGSSALSPSQQKWLKQAMIKPLSLQAMSIERLVQITSRDSVVRGAWIRRLKAHPEVLWISLMLPVLWLCGMTLFELSSAFQGGELQIRHFYAVVVLAPLFIALFFISRAAHLLSGQNQSAAPTQEHQYSPSSTLTLKHWHLRAVEQPENISETPGPLSRVCFTEAQRTTTLYVLKVTSSTQETSRWRLKSIPFQTLRILPFHTEQEAVLMYQLLKAMG